MSDLKHHPDLGDPLVNEILPEQLRRVIEQSGAPANPYRDPAPDPKVHYVDVGDLSPEAALAKVAEVRRSLTAPLGEPEPGGSYWEGMGLSADQIEHVDRALEAAMGRIPDLETRALVRRITNQHLSYYRRSLDPAQYGLVPELMVELLWNLSTTVLPHLFQVVPMGNPVDLLPAEAGARVLPVTAVAGAYKATNRAKRRVELDHGFLEWLLCELPVERTLTRAAVLDSGEPLLPARFLNLRGAGEPSKRASFWLVVHPSLANLWLPEYEDIGDLLSARVHKAGVFRADIAGRGNPEVTLYVDSQLPEDTALWGFRNGPTDAGAAWCPYVLLVPGPTVEPPAEIPGDMLAAASRHMRYRDARKLLDPAFYVRWSVTNAPRESAP